MLLGKRYDTHVYLLIKTKHSTPKYWERVNVVLRCFKQSSNQSMPTWLQLDIAFIVHVPIWGIKAQVSCVMNPPVIHWTAPPSSKELLDSMNLFQFFKYDFKCLHLIQLFGYILLHVRQNKIVYVPGEPLSHFDPTFRASVNTFGINKLYADNSLM